MLFTTEDRILIKHYRLDTKYGKRKMCVNFRKKTLDSKWTRQID